MREKMKKTKVIETKTKGKGVFAKEDIKKGETILFLDGEIWRKNKNEEYNDGIDLAGGPIGRDGNDILYLASDSDWVYINHSCDGNSGLINDKELIARRNIKKGEEITQDYSTIDIEAIKAGKKQLDMKCLCGTHNCRKIITTFDKLSKEKQEELREYLNSTVIELYDLK